MVDGRTGSLVTKRGDGLFQRPGARDQHFDAVGRQPDVAFADGAKIALHLVREQLAVALFDHAREPLQGVETAKEFFGDGGIGAPLADRGLQRQQPAANGGQVLIAFGEVVREKAVDEFAHGWDPIRFASSVRACVNKASGVNGLVMYTVAPACNAASRVAASPRVVSTITGTR